MNQKDLKERIEGYEKEGFILEAFVLQSAYIESLIKLYIEIKLNLSLQSSDNMVVSAIKDRIEDYSLYQLIHFAADCKWILSKDRDLIDRYRQKRNSVLHDLLRQVAQKDFTQEISDAYAEGKKIINLPAFSASDKVFRLIEQQTIRASLNTPPREGQAITLKKYKPRRATDRENEVLRLRLENHTYEVIAKKMGVTKERVRQILNSAISKIEEASYSLGTAYSGPAPTMWKEAPLIDLEFKSKIEDIFSTICSSYGVSKKELLSSRRVGNLIFPRQLVMYFLRENLKLSFPVIAKIMKKDHTTIMYAHRKMKKLLASEAKAKTDFSGK